TEEAYEKVTRIYREKYDDLQYRVVWQQVVQSVTLKDIGYSFTCDNAVDRAYSIGKEARLFRKVLRLFMPPTPIYLTSDFCYNAENLEAFVDLVASEIYSPYANNRYGIIGDSLVVYLGSPLQEMNKEALLSSLKEHVLGLTSATLTPEVKMVFPDPLPVDRILGAANHPATDAYFEVFDFKTVHIRPSKQGSHLDMEVLRSRLEEVEGQHNTSLFLPITRLMPEIHEEYLEANLFRDVLSSYFTVFQTVNRNTINRGVNIGIAGAAIHETVLGPGEEFSFNDIVGERSSLRGYQIANIYYDGDVVEGIGGGICQVSSTLYNAVLLTTLEVTKRVAHQLTVSYVPFGQDAAVSYGTLDLKFRNTSDWPVKILFGVETVDPSQNLLTFEIIGTSFDEVEVVVTNRTIQERPYPTTIVYDDTLPQGTVIVQTNGADGYVVETFRKVTINGETVSNQRIHVSYYQALPRKEIHGTKAP
ncbi:MAG: VanW family protein, partial [Clostridia bacterium]